MFGERGGIQLSKPFKFLPSEPITLIHHQGEQQQREETFPPCDQYLLQGEMASRVFAGESEPEFALGDAILNMRVLDAIRTSAEAGTWVELPGNT